MDMQAGNTQPQANTGFGAQPSTSGGLFGASQPASGGGLFGGGTTSQPSAFGQKPAQTSAFGQPATGGGLFGGGATATSGATGGGLFGQASQAPATGGLFGQQQQQQPQQSQPPASGGLFGGASTGGFGSSTTGGFGGTSGAFGAPKPASTPSFSFGQSASQPPASGGLFGQQQQQQPQGGGLFGQQQQQQPQTSAPATGGLFGQTQNTGGGLFGQQNQQQQPTSTPFGGFGQGATQNKPLFGGTSTGTSTFGQPAQAQNKPAFSFGQPASTPAPSGGLFGATSTATSAPGFGASAAPTSQPATGGGLFGGGFGQQNQQQQQQQPTGGLFGASKPATGGGLFGGLGQSTSQPQTGGLFGQSTTQPQQQQQQPQQQSSFGGFGGSLFGSSLGQQGQQQQQPQPSFALGQSMQPQQQQQQPQQTLFASADENPYGRNPLFANIGGPQQATVVSPAEQASQAKKTPLSVALKSTTPRSSTKVGRPLRGFGANSTLGGTPQGRSGSPSLFSSLHASGSEPRGSPLTLSYGQDGVDGSPGPGALVPRQSVKKLVIDHRASGEDLRSRRAQSANINGSPVVAPPVQGGGAAASTPGRSSRVTFEEGTTTKSTSDDLFGSKTTLLAPEQPSQRSSGNGESIVPAPITSMRDRQRGEYYSSPSLEQIRRMSGPQLRAVQDLMVFRHGYGSVHFREPVDLSTLASNEDLFGGVVQIEDRHCTVYPDTYYDKPEEGKGLNVPAVITLEDCSPIDKATREPLRDPKHPKVQQHKKRLQRIPETQFIDFDAETGRWTFAVQHF